MSPKGPHDYVMALRRKLATEVSMNIEMHVPAMGAAGEYPLVGVRQ